MSIEPPAAWGDLGDRLGVERTVIGNPKDGGARIRRPGRGALVDAFKHGGGDDGLAGTCGGRQPDGCALPVVEVAGAGFGEIGEYRVDRIALVRLQRELHRTPPVTLMV